MKKLLTGALALALSVSITACAKGTESPSSSPSSSPNGTSTSATTTSGTASATSGASATAAVDQSTPELAMTSWLNAMVSGDGNNVCRLMAINGKAISSIPGAAEACISKITPMLDQIKQLGGAFEGLTISGATVKGNTATFESVTTEPAMAADVVASFKAVKVDDKWYVTQG